tara:strand:+ start:395 stop:1144 length:750 start_codon:yes stop_codon:yes gene_type:complete
MAKNKFLTKPDTNQAAQSNELIEATYKMSVPAKRVMLMLLGEIHPGQQDISGKIRIVASDYAKKTGIDLSQSYKDIKNGCQELMGTIIETRDPKRKTTEMCVVVDWMKYHDDEGWLDATFTRWVSPYIQSLTAMGYTKIKIDEALKFKRFYTIRLYELLMQFTKTGERYIKISSLRKIFQIEKKKYSRFADLKRWVLEPSINEIESKTPWLISWNPVKSGRKTTSLSFSFCQKEAARCPDTMDMFEEEI